eukprot:TRINITY_DN7296_c0_g2_i11.p1 TRINITY_DN7296_c0_g2~~TRINITY_DN7296_c0_g2_i11.p1  ORF type:complete len:641 (+),score=121.82 TRINITY_DN7296_c0_g2_i11:54-1976(+)
MSESEDLKLKNQGLQHFPSNLPSHLVKLFLQTNRISQIPREISRLSRLSVLWLSENQISELPDYVFTLTTLVKLNVERNQIKDLPIEVGEFVQLKELYLCGNGLQSIPPSIQHLTMLQKLYASSNNLTALPLEIGELTALQFLSISHNGIHQLPASISRLCKLQRFSADKNALTCLPEGLGKLTQLREFLIQENDISALPLSISLLRHLCVLNVSHNKLAYLPTEFGALTSVRNIDASHNKLQRLPEEFCGLCNLGELDLSHNEIAFLPDDWHKLSNLNTLNMESNCLIAIPATIGNLPNLRVLNINQNELSFLPPTLGCISSLQALHVQSNPLKNLSRPLDRPTTPNGSSSSASLLAELRSLLPVVRPSSHIEDFRLLINNRSYADVKFIVGTRIILAHQFILSARCPQFNLWFQLGRRGEPKMREITVTDDVSADVFSKLMEFIYTGTIEELSKEDATDLRKLAKQYQLDRLSRICRDICEGEAKALKSSFQHERRTLLSQLRTGFLEEGFCDVCLVVEDRKINTHRVILQSRCEDLLIISSSASAPMTARRPSTASTGPLPLQEVTVENIRYVVMVMLLEYLYSDAVKADDMNHRDLLDLLAAANRFRVLRLKELIETALLKFITEDAVCDIFYVRH